MPRLARRLASTEGSTEVTPGKAVTVEPAGMDGPYFLRTTPVTGSS